MLGLSCQLRAQRIVHAIAKPRNNSDEAIRPPRVEERSSRPRRRPSIRALPVARFAPTHTRAKPKPGGTGPHLATEGRSAVSRRLANGAYHWLRVASCISSRQASVATTRGLRRGSLAGIVPDPARALRTKGRCQKLELVRALGELVRKLRRELER